MSKRARTAKSGGKSKKVDERIFDGLECIHADAAGIDIGSKGHYVSVPDGRDPQPVRCFGCFTSDLEEMAEWLMRCGIRTVAMESTGVYWVPSHRVLQEHGIEVNLVDARHAKNVPGRKTDVWDCRWLRRLHTYGLLQGCFIPPAEIQTVRSYWRQRTTLVDGGAQQIHRMQKALEQMNVQLHKAITDITGVTGMRIIRAIVAGEHDPVALAKMRDGRVQCSEATLVKALTGHYSEEHLFALQQALEAYDFFHRQMVECDERVRACMARFEDKEGANPPVPAPRRASETSKNEPQFDLAPELARINGVDLTKIPGIGPLTAQVIFTELGSDVSAFPSVKHFASWLCLCPNNKITGGKVRSSRTRRSHNRIANALRLAAQSLERKRTAMGAYYRRMKARLGPAEAVTATAHKLARMVYHMLRYGEAFVEKGQAEYEAEHHHQTMKRLQKQARSMGFSLVSQGTGEILT